MGMLNVVLSSLRLGIRKESCLLSHETGLQARDTTEINCGVAGAGRG